VNHTRLLKEDHLPDWARRDNKVTKTSLRTETCRREVLNIWRGFFLDKSKTNLYINHKDNETVAAVEQPAAVLFPGLITPQHGHKHYPCFCYPSIYILKKTARKPTVNSSFMSFTVQYWSAYIAVERKHIKPQYEQYNATHLNSYDANSVCSISDICTCT